MSTFLVTLHVIVVVLVVGPMVVAPFLAGRAIARHDPNLARVAGNALLTYGFGSLIAAGLGGLAVGASDGKYGFGTPWVIISMTLYVLILVLAVGYTAPASRKAAKMIEALAPARPPGGATSAQTPREPATPPPLAGAPAADDPGTATIEADLRTKQRIDAIVGRITGSGLLILLGVVLLVILMVVKPFGR